MSRFQPQLSSAQLGSAQLSSPGPAQPASRPMRACVCVRACASCWPIFRRAGPRGGGGRLSCSRARRICPSVHAHVPCSVQSLSSHLLCKSWRAMLALTPRHSRTAVHRMSSHRPPRPLPLLLVQEARVDPPTSGLRRAPETTRAQTRRADDPTSSSSGGGGGGFAHARREMQAGPVCPRPRRLSRPRRPHRARLTPASTPTPGRTPMPSPASSNSTGTPAALSQPMPAYTASLATTSTS